MADQGEPVDVVYLNFSKAFDSVCHRLLIKKMEAMGIHPKINRWVEEFLNYRIFRAKLGGQHSSEDNVKCGVPQGSLFGLHVFLIFINDLADELMNVIICSSLTTSSSLPKKSATRSMVINPTSVYLAS